MRKQSNVCVHSHVLVIISDYYYYYYYYYYSRDYPNISCYSQKGSRCNSCDGGKLTVFQIDVYEIIIDLV